MNVRLIVASANSTTKQIRLGAKTLVGRSSECNLRIASGLVSRRHCLIRVEGDTILVRDLGSSNGTRVNGELLEPNTEVSVVPGSALAIGPLKFIVQFAAPKETRDEDTEWLPRLPPDQTGSSADLIPGNQSSTLRTGDQPAEGLRPSVIQPVAAPLLPLGDETKDLLPDEIPRPLPTQKVVLSETGSSAVPPELQHADETDKQTLPDVGSLGSDNVLDPLADAEPAVEHEKPAEELNRRASETHLVIEEDDLRQMNLVSDAPIAPSSEDSDSFRPNNNDIDEELRKFLSGS
ncbi:MAG: FHA domain-containing protein [Planctomycetes bacterium]|nr:FHA domain-containing protein [Planctomycetota bacterium]